MVDLAQLKNITSSLTVLYVEDEQELRETMGYYLKKLFKSCEVCENGFEGLETYKNGYFDLVITDLQMPRMSGVEMIENIKEINSNQEILITSAYTETSYFMSCIKAGISGYIIKPIDFNQFNTEVYKVVSRHVALKENEMYHKELEHLVEERTKESIKLSQEQTENYKKTLLAMVELVEDRDTYTGGHSQRVALYSTSIAKEMGYDEKTCDLLYEAGILHDIGKVSTPDSILLKPGRLNKIEYKLIQEHVSVGYEVLRKIPMFKELADIIYSHHERHDGKGYPRGLKGDEIHPLAQIMIVADAFDAMTTNRIYKARKSVDEAITEIEQLASEQFNPKVVKYVKTALQNIDIAKDISQLPVSEVEKERFAYFFRDSITEAFNSNYLDFILVRNRFEDNFKNLYCVYLKNFSQYNKSHGWQKGNDILFSFANFLKSSFPEDLVFRFHGDDFIVISKKDINIDDLITNPPILENTEIKCYVEKLNLKEKEVFSFDALQKYFH